MGVLTPHHHGADEGQPDEEDAGQFLGYVDAGVEKVAQHDVAEDHDNHAGQQKDHKPFQAPEEEGPDLARQLLPP